MLAELAAIGGVVLDLVSATASTAVDIARMVFDLLALFVNWTINAVEQLFNFETSQPIAFILVFGTAFAVFALTPIVFGFNYNTALFGSPGESVQGGISAEPSSIQNMTDAEIAAIINDIELARLPSNPSVKLVQLRTVSSFFGGPSLFKTLFPQTSKLAEQDAGMFLYLNTMDNARVQWANQRYQQCGKIAFTETTPNNTRINLYYMVLFCG